MANIKGFLAAAGVAAAASLAVSSAALADDAPKFGYSLSIVGVSDYLFRGITYTEHDPAFQPYLEFTYGTAASTLYLGIWASNIHSNPTGTNGLADLRPWETDIYAGWRPVTNWFDHAVNWDLGALYYTYQQGSFSPESVNYLELKVSATTALATNLTGGFNFFFTPDQGAIVTPWTETIEGTLAYQLPDVKGLGTATITPTVSGLVGYTTAPNNSGWFLGQDNYTYWNAGLKLAIDKYYMDFRYYGTSFNNETDPNGLARDEFLFTAGVTLP
ncbi:TorF family putative porin [Hyphomicrobium sp.]|uniref:TorF family putative porin n=1 Tax=Hyphomicrobium sp. TaxID=82 RepID=UPI000F9BC902|nr:TorF family putative porin [Hyphomicrobium sp.]RUO97698.1 MAG: hypothetical protein EKK30_13140 [Hyphomicrobium sp.]